MIKLFTLFIIISSSIFCLGNPNSLPYRCSELILSIENEDFLNFITKTEPINESDYFNLSTDRAHEEFEDKEERFISLAIQSINLESKVLKALKETQSKITSEEIEIFLDFLSTISVHELNSILELIKVHPEKLAVAIRKATNERVCK